MNNNPLISVIMSVFNAESFLQAAIESILNQTYKHFEFIIIEDCSTDNSLKIIEKFKINDDRIIIIKKEKNNGVAGFINNLNLGLEIAKGKYIARMDADDISDINRFKKQIDFLENNPAIFIIGSSLEKIDINNNTISLLKAKPNNVDIKKDMIKNISLYHPVIMFRNGFDIRYREKAYYCEDYDLYLRLMLSDKQMANFSEPLLKYRILETSISRKDDKFTRWLFVEKIRCFYKENIKTGKDSYQSFNPENFKKILIPEIINNKKDLLFTLKYAIKYNRKDVFYIILTKIKRDYPNQSILLFRFYNFMPHFFSKKLYKLIPNY